MRCIGGNHVPVGICCSGCGIGNIYDTARHNRSSDICDYDIVSRHIVSKFISACSLAYLCHRKFAQISIYIIPCFQDMFWYVYFYVSGLYTADITERIVYPVYKLMVGDIFIRCPYILTVYIFCTVFKSNTEGIYQTIVILCRHNTVIGYTCKKYNHSKYKSNISMKSSFYFCSHNNPVPFRTSRIPISKKLKLCHQSFFSYLTVQIFVHYILTLFTVIINNFLFYPKLYIDFLSCK